MGIGNCSYSAAHPASIRAIYRQIISAIGIAHSRIKPGNALRGAASARAGMHARPHRKIAEPLFLSLTASMNTLSLLRSSPSASSITASQLGLRLRSIH
jgi:hypothetical protein